MTWNGSGTYNRLTTTVSPATANTTIDVADQNNYTADVATGINACLAKNGENAATGNLPMGGYKHTNVADGTAASDSVSLGQVQDEAYSYAADSGAADVYVIALSPTLIAYTAGLTIKFKASAANTGASTINVDAIGAKDIKTQALNDPEAGVIQTNGVYTIVYDGTQFQLQDIQHGNDVGFSAKDCSLSPATDTWTLLEWDVEVRDPGSNFASNAYTCPTDGVYQFNAAVSYGTMQADSGPTEIAIYVDGARYRSSGGNFNASAGVEEVDVNISISDAFSAGDVITAYTRHQGAATEATQDAKDQTYFNGHRIILID